MKKLLKSLTFVLCALFVTFSSVACSLFSNNNSNNKQQVVNQPIDYRRRAVSFLNSANAYLVDINNSLDDANSDKVYFSSTSKSEMDMGTKQIYDDFVELFDKTYFYPLKLATCLSYLGEFALNKNLNILDEIGDRSVEVGAPSDAKSDSVVKYNFFYYFESDNVLSCEVKITLKEPKNSSEQKTRDNTYYVYEKITMNFDSYLNLENICVLRKDYYVANNKNVPIKYNILNMNMSKSGNTFSNLYFDVDGTEYSSKSIADISNEALPLKTVLSDYAREVRLYTGTLYYSENNENNNEDSDIDVPSVNVYASEGNNIQYFYKTKESGTLESSDYQRAVSRIKTSVYYTTNRNDSTTANILFFRLQESFENNFGTLDSKE